MWLLNTDIAIDYSRPTLPNVVEMGGLTTGAALKSLSADLEQFVSGADDGVIIVSFGSFAGSLPTHVREKLLAAFKQVEQRVVWRQLGKKPEDLPDHIKIMSWLPQADLLAHPNVKLFITHCGANGQFEGLYHAVPMIGFPIHEFADQMYNSARMQSKGLGLSMDMAKFHPKELVENIRFVVSEPSYKDTIRKESAIYRDRPDTPTERAVYWIEHVMKHGGDYILLDHIVYL